jgi:alpha-mannosidase
MKTFSKNRLKKFFVLSEVLILMMSFSIPVAAQETVSKSEPASKTPKYDSTKDKVLYMVGYAHLDTQWRWSYRDSILKFIPNTMHFNFDFFEKYPNYVFNFTGSRRYKMMKEYYPDDYAKVKEYIKKGQWHVCGSSVDECDANIPSSESIIRHVLYGNDYYMKEFGKKSEDFVLPDCFGFPSALPSILAHCGVKGFSTQKLTWHSAVGIPFAVGVWEGPDGKSILATLDPGGYGSQIKHDLSYDQGLLKRINALGEKSGAYVDYRYYGTGDIGGSPTEGSVQWIEKSLKSDGPIKVISSPADQIFKDLKPEQIEKLPRYKGDLLLTEHSAGCLTSQCYMKRWNRKNELLADAAERAAVTAMWLGGMDYPADRLLDAWYLVLGSQMHDIMPGTCIPEAYEFSWNDEVVAMNLFSSVLQNAAGTISSELDTRCEGIPVVVYNPLSIQREDIVEAILNFEGKTPKSVRVFNPDGKEVPSQVIGKKNNQISILFLADVPPVGFSVFEARASEDPCKIKTGLEVTASSLENNRYYVLLDEKGDVVSVKDKKENQELLSAPVRLGFFEDSPREWPAWNMDWDDKQQPVKSYVEGPASVKVLESGPVRVAVKVDRKAEGSEFTQIIRLGAGSAGDRLEFDNTIDWRTKEACLKACFPLAVSNPIATYNQDMGTIERGNNDPKKYEVPSHKWIDLTDKEGKYGVAILEDCKYGSDKPDDNTIRLTLVRTPVAYSYEDQATQDLGVHRMVFAIAGHKGDWREEESYWKAERLNQPLIPLLAKPHAGKLGKICSLLKINTSQVAVQAIKKAENSDEIIIRLQELQGKPCSKVKVTFGSNILSSKEVNGQESPIGEAEFDKGNLVFDIGAYSPKSYSVKLVSQEVNITKPLSKYLKIPYEMDSASFDKKPAGAGFDGTGLSYPAELLPGSLSCGGVEFKLGQGENGNSKALSCRGQKIDLPRENYNKIYLLASAVGGDVPAVFRIDDRPVDLTIQEWTGKIGQWNNRLWQNGKKEILGLQPCFIKHDPIAWYASHIHNEKGENEPYQYCYMFQYSLDVSPGAKTLVLPNDDRIRIFAVTAALNYNDAVSQAKPLYDELEQEQSEPRIQEVTSDPKDSMAIRILPGWFSWTKQIYYTTNGENPGSSPDRLLYQKPFFISKDTVVMAGSPEKDGGVKTVASRKFSLNDVTPPSVLHVSATRMIPYLVVEFSEPLEKSSAEETDHYEILSGAKIFAAKLNPDEISVTLSLSEYPEENKKHTLFIHGVKDKSPKGNAVKVGTKIAFTTVNRILHLDFDDPGEIGRAWVRSKKVSAEIKGKPTPVEGKFGGALRFNGDNECLILQDRPEFNPDNAITITTWFNADDWNGNRRILQKGNNDNQYRLLKEGDRFKFSLNGIGELSCDVPSAGEWHHAAGTWDGNVMRLFIDGNLVGEAEASGTIPKTPDPIYIGTKTLATASGDFFKGALDEVLIWDYELAPEHIEVLAMKE